MHRLLLLLLLLPTSLSWSAENPQLVSASSEPKSLVVWNREIVVFRANVRKLSPAERRDSALERMRFISDRLLLESIRHEPAKIGGIEGRIFMIGDQILMGLVEQDLDPTSGQTLEEAADEVQKRLETLKQAKLEQRRMPVIVRGIAFSIVATLVFVLLLVALKWMGRRISALVGRWTAKLKALKVHQFDIRPILLRLFQRVLILIGWLVGLFAAYTWVGTVLAQFPYTQPWADKLARQVTGLLSGAFNGLLSALPGLMLVVLIFAITRSVAQVANNLFRQFEFSKHDEKVMTRDAARASRRIFVAVIWIFGFAFAYPHLPGSESVAFKGISVLVGLMVSLGSAGLINQIMSGFVVLYSQAVRRGEYAKFGDVEGTVVEIGLLSTKIVTPRGEYVTVPNAVLVSKESLNYSRLQGDDVRTQLSTKVTIGYDTPWRQVKAMLLKACAQAPGIRTDCEPMVLQTALSDFYIEYELRFVPTDVSRRGATLSGLHERILDVFNEYGVQIMSPNFNMQPDGLVLSPKEHWFDAPAKPPEPKEVKG